MINSHLSSRSHGNNKMSNLCNLHYRPTVLALWLVRFLTLLTRSNQVVEWKHYCVGKASPLACGFSEYYPNGSSFVRIS